MGEDIAEMGGSMGVTQGLVRLSTGIEDVEDLVGDIEQALRPIQL